MSDAPPAPEQGAPSADTETETPAPAPQPEDVSGLKKALEAERKARRDADAALKELQPLAAKAKEAEEANKSEVQRAMEALDGERRARTEAETKLLRFEVANDKGIPAELVRFLTGSTRDELEDAADSLLAAVNKTTKPKPTSRSAERVATGQTSTSALDAMSPADLAAHVLD